ncbi:MAG: hypothetical protein BWK80_52240 [Desulfobacteraceae bacterium IS3]|nr:MAG: hypothetical protein BWK80_52240 [Desulfobacteraceae bacterium IS3]
MSEIWHYTAIGINCAFVKRFCKPFYKKIRKAQIMKVERIIYYRLIAGKLFFQILTVQFRTFASDSHIIFSEKIIR